MTWKRAWPWCEQRQAVESKNHFRNRSCKPVPTGQQHPRAEAHITEHEILGVKTWNYEPRKLSHPLPRVTPWTCWGKGQGKSKRGTSNSTCLFSAAFDLCGKEDVKKIPLFLLEKENGLGVYCKGNENKARSKRMLASSRNWVKEEEESETNVIWDSPRKRLRVWAGSKAAHPKGEGAFGLMGA